MKGKVTLQLHDGASSKLLKEVVIENFASNLTIGYAQYLQKSAIKSGLSSLGVSDPVYAPHIPSSAMVLTDSTKAEDQANEWFMHGATLGWAEKNTYAGTDIWRGTVDITGLEATPTSVKWVFDWPTHAGNGTIGSVGWVRHRGFDLSATDPEFRVVMTELDTYPSAGVWYNFAQASSALAFGCTGNTTVYVLDSVYSQTTTFNINAEFTAVSGIAWDSTNSFLWVIGDDSGANKIIAAYNQAGILQTGPFILTNRAYERLTHDGTHLWSLSNITANQYTAWRIDPSDGSDVTNFNLNANVSNRFCGLAWDSYNSLLWTRDRDTDNYGVASVQAWDTSGGKQSVGMAIGSRYTSNQGLFRPSDQSYNVNIANHNGYSHTDLDVVSNGVFALPYNTTVYTARGDGMSTRARLPTPVTKNNTQTLKLIYEITYV